MLCVAIGWTKEQPESREPKTALSIISHRGANDRQPEHSISAYQQAIQDQADYIEIDLRMTKDRQLVALHDETVNRTTNGTGKVENFTLAELEKLTLVSTQKEQEKIPTLVEILEKFGKSTRYYIELRESTKGLDMVEPLIQLLEKNDLDDENFVLLQSFSSESLIRARQLAPNLSLTWLMKAGDFDLNSAVKSDFATIGIESREVTDNIVRQIHQAGKQVHVYFINKKSEKAEQKRLLNSQVDGYFTDFNLFTKKLINRE